MNILDRSRQTSLVLTKENHERIAAISSMLYMSEDKLVNELLDAILNQDKGMYKDLKKLCASRIPEINHRINEVKPYEQPAYFSILSRYDFMEKVLDPKKAKTQLDKEILKIRDAYAKVKSGNATQNDKTLFLASHMHYSKLGCNWLLCRLLDKNDVSREEIAEFDQLVDKTVNEVF